MLRLWPLRLCPFKPLADSLGTGSLPRSPHIRDDRAPLYPFMFTLGYRTCPAPPGLRPLNLLTDSSCSGLLPRSLPSRCPGSPTPARHTSPLITRGNPFLGYSTGFQRYRFHSCGFNVSPRLVSDEGGMTFGYLWQAGSCGLLKSYSSPFLVFLSYRANVSCI